MISLCANISLEFIINLSSFSCLTKSLISPKFNQTREKGLTHKQEKTD